MLSVIRLFCVLLSVIYLIPTYANNNNERKLVAGAGTLSKGMKVITLNLEGELPEIFGYS